MENPEEFVGLDMKAVIGRSLRNLAEARAALDVQLSEVERLEVALAATEPARMLAAAEDRLREHKAIVSDFETQVRNAALIEYRSSGNKAPTDGVSVKIYKVLHYDPDVALAWVKENIPSLVVESLDKKGFEKVSTTLGGPVVVEEDPRVSIARDLSALVTHENIEV